MNSKLLEVLRVAVRLTELCRGVEWMILRWLRGSEPEPSKHVDWPKAKIRLIASVTEMVAPLGLVHQKGLVWVAPEANQDGIRPLFRINDGGLGRDLTVMYGFSYDFNPHLQSGDPKWHRTVASARPDLTFVEIDVRRIGISRYSGEAEFDLAVKRAVSNALPNAGRVWRDLDGLESHLPLLRCAACYQTDRPGVYRDYAHIFRSVLSLPFALARLGLQEEAMGLWNAELKLAKLILDPDHFTHSGEYELLQRLLKTQQAD